MYFSLRICVLFPWVLVYLFFVHRPEHVMDAVVTGLLACQIILLYCICLFVELYLCIISFAYLCIVSLGICVFVSCTQTRACDGCSGDWVIGLSNHINEGAQEGNAPEQGIYGASLSLLSNVASSFPSLSSEMCSTKQFQLSF